MYGDGMNKKERQIKELEEIIKYLTEDGMACFGGFDKECIAGLSCIKPCKLYVRYKQKWEAKSKT